MSLRNVLDKMLEACNRQPAHPIQTIEPVDQNRVSEGP
jgi:hypothetical protein